MRIYIAVSPGAPMDRAVRRRISTLCAAGHDLFLSGMGSPGLADFLLDMHYDHITLFTPASGGSYNPGDWPAEKVPGGADLSGFPLYRHISDYAIKNVEAGLFSWDGQSRGVLYDLLLLAGEQKPALVYLSTVKRQYIIRSRRGLEKLIRERDSGA